MRRKGQSSSFHVEGWHPALVAGLGVLAGWLVVSAAYYVLLRLTGSDIGAETGTVLAAFVTATVGGGAAGLTMKNLNLKRAESRRDTNLMFDGQFQTGAKLLGGDTESEVIAGSLLLGSLLRESPRHAQACADLLCAALRKRRRTDLTREEEADLYPDPPTGYEEELASSIRVRNAITRAIAHALGSDGAPGHLRGVRWEFRDVFFGDNASFTSCIFGDGTEFVGVVARGAIELTGSTFVGGTVFENVTTWAELKLRGVSADGVIELINCRIRGATDDGMPGVFFNSCRAEGIRVVRTVSDGPLHLDGARVNGDIRVTASKFLWLSFIDGLCDRFITIEDTAVAKYLCIRRTPTRKGVSVVRCSAAEEIEVTGVETLGDVDVVDCTYAELKLGDAAPDSHGGSK